MAKNYKLAGAIARKGVTQVQLSIATGVPRSALGRYLSGSGWPSARNALALARFLDSTVEELFGHLLDDGDPAPSAVTRCADCAHCKQVRDGSGVWCELWRHRTRADGYCHMGEVE